MRISIHRFCPILLFLASLGSCSYGEHDDYLRSLRLRTEYISPEAILDLEESGILKPRQFCFLDGRFYVSKSDGKYNITVIDPQQGIRTDVLRRGRGPCEVYQGSSLHISDGRVIFNDSGSAICIGLNYNKDTQKVAIDTIARFNLVGARPYFMCKSGDYFISGNISNPDCWYASFDKSGEIKSEVCALSFPELEGKGKDLRASLMLSSLYASSPDATKVCVANVMSASLSFSYVNGGKLSEYNRIQYNAPEMSGRGFSPESVSCFNGIAATDESVYVLYSGRNINGDVPRDECMHLIHYSWDGTPIKRYSLTHSLSAICCSGGKMYGMSTYPTSQIYMVPIHVE